MRTNPRSTPLRRNVVGRCDARRVLSPLRSRDGARACEGAFVASRRCVRERDSRARSRGRVRAAVNDDFEADAVDFELEKKVPRARF